MESDLGPLVYWDIEYWESQNGVSYAGRDLLDDMAESEAQLFERLGRQQAYLTENYPIHRTPPGTLIKARTGIYELTLVLPKKEVRFLGTIVYTASSTVFYVLCAYIYKNASNREKNIQLAEKRLKEFKSSNDPPK